MSVKKLTETTEWEKVGLISGKENGKITTCAPRVGLL